MSRRVRRDSETSTDSWSLVEEEDRLDDDFSLHSTDNDEGAEPIIEEPPTSDEETASEKSIDSSEDEDSEFSDEEEEEDSENEEEEIQESQEILENSDISDEESEDSESDDSEEEDDVASEIAEVLEMNDEELAEAAARLKEDEKWMDQELEECESQETRRSCRVLLAFTVFLMIFPLAELFTSWMLTYQNHRFVSRNVDYVDRFVFEDYGSQQSYPSKLTEEQLDKAWVEKVTRKSGGNLYKLRDIIHPKPAVKEHEILDIFTRRQNWKRQSDAPINRTTVIPTWQSYSKYYSLRQSTVIPNYRILPKSNISMAQCRALAPVPPAPFTPRRRIQNRIPRHQPCLVHVNQSKWTCQKNLPSVIYETTPIYTVVPPRGFGKTKGMGRSGGEKRQKRQTERFDVCGKKASQSMRTISKPTDQCHSRHFSKFTPRRKHIAYKAPLPCKVPTYKPTMPKQSFKPSSDDWHQQRSLHRAQLRSRA